MKKSLMLLLPLAVFSFPALAAEGDTYAVVQYALVTYDEDGVDEVEPTALVFKYGQFVNENVAIEGRFGIGLQEDDVSVFGLDVDVEVESIIGVYGVFHSSSSSDNVFYGVVGYTRGELEVSIDGSSDSDSETDFSLGFGANFGAFNVEYMLYLDESDFDATAISLGYVF